MRFSIGLMLALSFGVTNVARAEVPKCDVTYEFKKGKLGIVDLDSGIVPLIIERESDFSDRWNIVRDTFLHLTVGGKALITVDPERADPQFFEDLIAGFVKAKVCVDGRLDKGSKSAVTLAQELTKRLAQAPEDERRVAAKVLQGLFTVKSDASTANVPTLQFLGETLPEIKGGR